MKEQQEYYEQLETVRYICLDKGETRKLCIYRWTTGK